MGKMAPKDRPVQRAEQEVPGIKVISGTGISRAVTGALTEQMAARGELAETGGQAVEEGMAVRSSLR